MHRLPLSSSTDGIGAETVVRGIEDPGIGAERREGAVHGIGSTDGRTSTSVVHLLNVTTGDEIVVDLTSIRAGLTRFSFVFRNVASSSNPRCRQPTPGNPGVRTKNQFRSLQT